MFWCLYLVLDTVAPNPGRFPNLLTASLFFKVRTRLPFSTLALLGIKSDVQGASRGSPEKLVNAIIVSGLSKFYLHNKEM
jgi:hypothetical protein